MKNAITSPECMLLEIELHADTSKKNIGVMLAQTHNGKLRPVRFVPRCLRKSELIWNTLHHELFAVKYGFGTFRHYLLGLKTKVVTDHVNLKYLNSILPQQSKLARWYLALAEFDFYIVDRPGQEHVVPDFLSRNQIEKYPELTIMFYRL